MKVRNRLLASGTIVAVAAALFWALRPQPVSVEAVEVQRGTFEQTVDDDGKTRVRERYLVAAPLAGRLSRITLKSGDAVAAGAVVASIQPNEPALQDDRTVRELEERVAAGQAAVMRATALEARAKGAQEQARADATRSARLAIDGFLSAAAREQTELAARMRENEFEAARFERVVAERELAQTRAALMRVRTDLQGSDPPGKGFEVRAPVTGRVLRVMQESAGPVTPGVGLLEVGDVGRLEVVADILSSQAVDVRPGAEVHVETGAGAPSLRGRVRHVEPSAFTKVSALGVEEQRVNVVIDFSPAPSPNALGDAYRVDVRIVVHRADDVVLVPTGAMFRDGAGYAVFVVENGAARKRPVQTPRRNAQHAWVTSGVSPGERVIAFPSDAVADGARVSVRGAER